MEELEKSLILFYKSENGFDIIKLYKEMQEANFYFTKKFEKNLLKKIEECKSKEKFELNLEQIENFLENLYPSSYDVLKAFLEYKKFLLKKEEIQLNIEKQIEKYLSEALNKELKILLDKSNEIIDIINEEEKNQKEYLNNYFKQFETLLNNNKQLFDTLDISPDENEDNKILFNKYIKYLYSIKGNEIEENKINNLYNIILEKNNEQNIDIKKYFIICKLILILKNDSMNYIKNIYSNYEKIFFQILSSTYINSLGNNEIEESVKKFDEYKEKIIYDNIVKNMNNYFGENINIKEQIYLFENNNHYTYKYNKLYDFFKELNGTKEKSNIIPLTIFIKLIKMEDNKNIIFESINNYIKDEKSKKNKQFEFIKNSINIYGKEKENILIEKLNKDKIIIYYDKKLHIHSTNDLSLLFVIDINIISPIILLKNGKVLFITSENNKNNNYITIINSNTSKIEQKIPIIFSGDIISLIELSNGDIVFTNDIGIIIYTKKNEKYIFFKLLPFGLGIDLKKINENSFIFIGEMIIKFSIKDYSIIGIIPNLGHNKKLEKIKNDIYVLYGGSIGGGLSYSLICFLDMNKFEIIFYRYLDKIILDIIPLLGENFLINSEWFAYTNSCEKEIYKKISKPFKYENVYGFIDSSCYNSDNDDDYERIRNIDKDVKRFIKLNERKILYQDEFKICLMEYSN